MNKLRVLVGPQRSQKARDYKAYGKRLQKGCFAVDLHAEPLPCVASQRGSES